MASVVRTGLGRKRPLGRRDAQIRCPAGVILGIAPAAAGSAVLASPVIHAVVEEVSQEEPEGAGERIGSDAGH
jgi:hypothetical protein